MLQDVDTKRHEIAELCRRFHVRRLELFGSATGGEFDATRSDLDFLVEFEASPQARTLDVYVDLKAALERLFGRRVDLLEASAVRNPYLRDGIERSREPVFGPRS